MILWKYCLSTCLLIVITDSKTSNNLDENTRTVDNDFTKMLHSIIKINEKRVNSLKTLTNLDEYNKAKAILRKKLNIYEGSVKKPQLIGIIIGEDENTDTSVEENILKYRNLVNRRRNGVANRHGKRIKPLGNYRLETIVRPMNKDSDISSASEMDCNPNKNNCDDNGNGNGNGNGKCKSQCASYCIDSCNNAFKHFCLTYACDYSMKAQMENECNDYC